jgi:molecular chaperone DnaK (HSP70)
MSPRASHVLRLLTILLCFYFSMTTASYPIGVSFGPTRISAAYISADNSTRHLASVQGRPDYVSLLSSSLATDGRLVQRRGEWFLRQDDGALKPTDAPSEEAAAPARKIFVDALKDISDAAALALGQDQKLPPVTALAVPDHLPAHVGLAAAQAAQELWQEDFKQPAQRIDTSNAARLAYGLDNEASLGLEEDGLSIDDGPHHVLVVERGGESLEISLLDVGYLACFREARISQAKVDDRQAEKVTRRFVAEKLLSAKGDKGVSEDLRAVVLAGEGDEESMRKLRSLLVEVFGSTRVKNGVKDGWVAAEGAAYRAKVQIVDSTVLREIPSTNIIPDHDEL